MTAPALGPASSLASAAVDTAPATGVLGCPSCDCIRLRALLTPASSGALVARVRAGHHGQPAGWLSLVAAGLDSGVLDELRAAPACTSELAPRTATGDEELPEASLRVLAAGALVRHRAGGGGFPGAGPPALTDDAVRAAARRSGDVPGGRRLPHRALPAAASAAGWRPSRPQPYGCSSRPTTRRLGQQRRHRRAKRSTSPANAGPAGYRVRRTP